MRRCDELIPWGISKNEKLGARCIINHQRSSELLGMIGKTCRVVLTFDNGITCIIKIDCQCCDKKFLCITSNNSSQYECTEIFQCTKDELDLENGQIH